MIPTPESIQSAFGLLLRRTVRRIRTAESVRTALAIAAFVIALVTIVGAVIKSVSMLADDGPRHQTGEIWEAVP